MRRSCRWAPTRSRSWFRAGCFTTDPVGAFGYSEDEIRAVVAEAAGRGTYVWPMLHGGGHRARRELGRAHHRTRQPDRRPGRRMAELGAYAIPTLVTYEALANEGAMFGLPPESIEKIARSHGRLRHWRF